MKVILFIGIPASGKSSFYQERFALTHLRINRDMLRTKHREFSLFRWCLDHEQACVLDNTNTTREIRRPFLEAVAERRLEVAGYYFESNLQVCLERNRLRTGAAMIPELGLKGHRAKLEMPELSEGFAELNFVRLVEGGGATIEPWSHEI